MGCALVAYVRDTKGSKVLASVPQTPLYTFPLPSSVRHVIVDIGLYNSIVTPREGEFVIAVDASLREIEASKLSTSCETLGSCLLISAAVGSSTHPFVNLQQSQRSGGSSHITNFDSAIWPMEMRPAVVPLISLKTLIDAVPRNIPIILCKTDTNGNDGAVLHSAGDSLRRCLLIIMEIVGPRDGTGPPDQYETAIEVTRKCGFRLDPRYSGVKQESGSYNLYFDRPPGPNQLNFTLRDMSDSVQ